MRKRLTWARSLVALLVIVLSGSVAFVMHTLSNFYQCVDDYSGQVARGDAVEARAGLERLTYFYDLNSKLPVPLRNFVSRRFLKDAKLYQAQLDSMTGLHDKAVQDLRNENGYYAHQITGNAKWRMAQDAYKHAASLSDPKVKKEEIEKAYKLAESTKEDYEKALRANPNSHEASWNYELMTIAGGGAMRAALEPQQGKIRIRLGKGKGKGKGEGKGKNGGLGGEGTENVGESGDKKGSPKPSERRPG